MYHITTQGNAAPRSRKSSLNTQEQETCTRVKHPPNSILVSFDWYVEVAVDGVVCAPSLSQLDRPGGSHEALVERYHIYCDDLREDPNSRQSQ